MIRLWSFFIIVIQVVLISGCRNEELPPTLPPLVKTTTTALAAATTSPVYSGTVRGRYESSLGFQVGGRLNARYVDIGQTVRKGDLLLEIDAKDLQEGTRMAKAQMDAAESKLKLAQADLKRYERLYKDGAAAKAIYEQYLTAADAAEEEFRQAGAQYQQNVNALGYSRLSADADGVIASLQAEVGQVVAAGYPVATLVRAGSMEVEVAVPENKISRAAVGLEGEVSFWAMPGIIVIGRVREISPMADPVTRTYTVRLSLPSPPPSIQLGMTATVRLGFDADDRHIYLPLSAIYQSGGQPSVWVMRAIEGSLEAGDKLFTAQLYPVTLGNFDTNRVAVMSGLKEGEIVATAGVHKLYSGQIVRLMD